MTIYKLSDFPAARPDTRVHLQGGHTPRAACGAGYNWATDTQFATELDEITCEECRATIAEHGWDWAQCWDDTVKGNR